MNCLNRSGTLCLLLILPLLAGSCKRRQSSIWDPSVAETGPVTAAGHTNPLANHVNTEPTLSNLPAGFVELAKLDSNIQLDIRYAGIHNFTNKKLYPCAKCILKEDVALKLTKVDSLLKFKNLRLLVLDCYRPPEVQEQLWKSYPDPHYIMRPWKGSPHSRGIAVDVTLTDLKGNIQDMGSGYDEFSPRSYYFSKEISSRAKYLRLILRTAMKHAGFTGIRTEWWHYQLGRKRDHPVRHIPLPCD